MGGARGRPAGGGPGPEQSCPWRAPAGAPARGGAVGGVAEMVEVGRTGALGTATDAGALLRALDPAPVRFLPEREGRLHARQVQEAAGDRRAAAALGPQQPGLLLALEGELPV